MALFAVTLTDQTIDVVEGADAYQQEGPMTTFFALGDDRRVIDSWSMRLASYRTADIAAIRRSARAPMEQQLDDEGFADDVSASHAILASA